MENNNNKMITIIMDDTDQVQQFEKICSDLNISCTKLKCIQNLFGKLSIDTYKSELIILDIEKLRNYASIGVLDVILTIKTLIKCVCQTQLPNIITIPVAVSVNLNTDVKLIREVMSTGYVLGIYPNDNAFSAEEKALASMIKNEQHVPKRLYKLINEKKITKSVKTTNEITLTARQQQILDLIVNKGASNKLIARILNISESTVKLHMSHILRKYGLTNRTQLALFSKAKNLDPVTV